MTDSNSSHAALRAKTQQVYDLLYTRYGEIPREKLDPVSETVCTILSQNTSDINRDKAYTALRARFPTWEEVRRAPVEAVREAIRPAGLATTKAPRIQAALDAILARAGALDLSFLRTLSVPEAKAWLTSLNGIGPKTAAIILLFALDLPAFPVDTHVHRVSGRLGLIEPGVSAEHAHEILEALVPPALYLPYHMLLITHGRQTCHARRPDCAHCPLTALCDAYRAEQV